MHQTELLVADVKKERKNFHRNKKLFFCWIVYCAEHNLNFYKFLNFNSLAKIFYIIRILYKMHLFKFLYYLGVNVLYVRTFERKLLLWKKQLQDNNFVHFPTCTTTARAYVQLQANNDIYQK